MSFSEIKKELKKLEKENLIDLIADLYKKNKAVKELLDFYINPDETNLFNKYRDLVYTAFNPKRGYKLKLKQGKQAISDFKKLEPSPELLADLMLFYVETGVKFTNQFGDVDYAFYNSVASTFQSALNYMKKEDLLEIFKIRAKKILTDTEGIGWGFYDDLNSTYFDFFDD